MTGNELLERSGWATLLVVAAALAGPAARASDSPEVRPGEPQRALRLSEASPSLELDLDLLQRLGRVHPEATPADQPLRLRFPGQPPADMALRLRVHPLLALSLTAALDDELPRLDALDGETYFSVGAELRLTRSLDLFVEDFQPASGVVGEPELDAGSRPERSWDGHQVSLGLRLRPAEGVVLSGALVAYVLSDSDRTEGLGGAVSARWEF